MSGRTICAVIMLAAAFGLPRASEFMSKIELPTINQTEDKSVVTVPEAQVWSDLADWCEAGQCQDTDEVIRLAEGLKTLGKLSDLSRLDKYRSTCSPVTAEFIQSLRQ
jgi:hypothetical protein